MSSENFTNPFVGLRPFESNESLLFFGRQDQITELLQRLHYHHFVAIIGNSGSGKSSLIRAGLIPRLKAGYLVNDRDDWAITIMKPGKSPLYNLANAIQNQLRVEYEENNIKNLVKKITEEGVEAVLEVIKQLWEKKNTNFFLLIDQFEELFRYSVEQKEGPKQDEAIDFVNIMLELSQQTTLPVYVSLTMRSDFMGDCARFYGLPEAMNKSSYLVPRLNRIELKNAIEGPVKLYEGKINPALTAKLLNDTQTVKDELPLLQHVMMRMWEHEMNVDKNGELDLKDYENTGGIEKALSNHADEALEGLSEGQIKIVKKIFQALTKLDENGRKIRRPATLRELEVLTGAGKNTLITFITRFIEGNKSFLVINKTEDENDLLIDISHESLIREWETLNKWVDEEAESAKVYMQLVESYTLHNNGRKDFLMGSELQLTLEWYNEFRPVFVWARRYHRDSEDKSEQAFIETIQYLLNSEEEWKTQRRNKLLVIGGITGLIIVILATFLFIQTNQKKEATNLKEGFRLIYLAQKASFEDPLVALRVAEAALHKSNDSLILKGSQEIYQRPVFLQSAYNKTIVRDTSQIHSVAFSPDGSKFLTGSADKIARLWSVNGKLIRKFKGHKDLVISVAFSPDGTKVLTGSFDNTARLWNVNGGLIREFKGHTGPVFSVAFSPDGSKVLTGSFDKTARLCDMNDKLITEFNGPSGHILSVDFSPDGSKVLVGSDDGTARLWNMNGELIGELKGHAEAVNSVAFSPDGSKVLTGSGDKTARLWNLNGELITEFNRHSAPVVSVAFSPDGNKVVTGSFDKTARLWYLHGELIREFKGHSDGIWSVACSPDGSKVLTGSEDRTARLWNVNGELIREFQGHTAFVRSVAFSPDGTNVLTGSEDKTARLWNVNGELIRDFKGHTAFVRSVAFSPDGSKLLTGSDDRTVRLWNLNGELIREFKGHTQAVGSVAFSPDGSKMLTGSYDTTARLWNVNGELIREFKGHTADVKSVAFSLDGSKLLTASSDKTARLWNVNGELIKEFKGHTGPIYSIAFSPDGSKVLTGSGDETARLWNVNGELIREFKGHVRAVYSVAFSPDGTKVLTGSDDKTGRLWNVNGGLIREFKGHTGYVFSVGFSPDGSKVLTGSEDNTARLWNAIVPTLEQFLKSNKIDQLTAEQKKEFGIK